MESDGTWKAAANLELLLGHAHPPARLETDVYARPAQGQVVMDARNTANFRTSSYCGCQDAESSEAVFRQLVHHYRFLLRRINLDDEEASSSSTGVKPEPNHDDEGGVVGASPSATQYRAVGILTHVHDGFELGQETTPWELMVIAQVEEDASYVAAIRALTHSVDVRAFPLLGGASAASDPSTHAGGGNDVGEDGGEDGPSGLRLSLFMKLCAPFTGVYPGAVVGIVGEPFQRSARGVLTGVLVHRICLPTAPNFPWRVDRPLSTTTTTTMGSSVPLRVHFCSGPFPRRDIIPLLQATVMQALHRGAHLLIIGGPLVKPFDDIERDLLPTLNTTFSELVEVYVDRIEETLSSYYATRPHVPHMKVLLVSHRDDVMQVPVLPTTMYAVADTEDVLVRSNPCRVAINGIHFSVCHDDVIGDMRTKMVEKWPTAEGSLRRVAEAVLQSRLFTPIFQLPLPHADVKALAKLRMDFRPEANELLEMHANDAAKTTSVVDGGCSTNWNLLETMEAAELASTGTKMDVKRMKVEEEEEDGTTTTTRAVAMPSSEVGAMEWMPHVMFLPSTRRHFAMVSHRAGERNVDAVEEASGVLVVNPEIWSRRTSQTFGLRVAEITIPNCGLVAARGASPANGVACGILHIFKSE